MKARSLISWTTSWRALPEIAVLNLRGRFWNSSSVTICWISRIAGVASMISSLAMPATGEPKITRGTSPQASQVFRPLSSSFCQIAGTSSMRTQWNWMFWRSVRSTVERA